MGLNTSESGRFMPHRRIVAFDSFRERTKKVKTILHESLKRNITRLRKRGDGSDILPNTPDISQEQVPTEEISTKSELIDIPPGAVVTLLSTSSYPDGNPNAPRNPIGLPTLLDEMWKDPKRPLDPHGAYATQVWYEERHLNGQAAYPHDPRREEEAGLVGHALPDFVRNK